ncbi:MAG: MqnA/MqnD/SBP family protein, partial [Bacteroidota bacterium]
IISDYCIAAEGKVESVLLVSHVPLEEIKTIVLDNQSRTSVMLSRILAEELWKINPEWITETAEHPISESTPSAVVIGDRALAVKSKFQYVYDLAEEWDELTMLPFVFACWVSNKKLPQNFIEEFNAALASGLNQIDKLTEVEYLSNADTHYLKNVIKYNLDSAKREAIDLFLEKAGKF